MRSIRNEAPALSRQARKTYEAIKTDECVPTRSVHRLLECLGFKMTSNGTHQTWRHPKGYRITLVFRQRDDGIWGWELNKVRKLLTEIETKEQRGGDIQMGMANEKTREKMSGSEVRSLVDSQVLAEKSIPQVNKIDLTGHEQHTMLRTLSDAFNQQAAYLQRLGSMVQSVQEYLIELSVKMDNIQLPQVAVPAPAPKRELTEEERLASWRANQKKVAEKRRERTIAKIKEAQHTYPQFAKNAKVLAGLVGSNVVTVEKYFKEGLV